MRYPGNFVIVIVLMKHINNVNGFTLLEVLLGLAVIAIALTALIASTSKDISQTIRINETMVENWVAKQVINQIQLGLLVPSNQSRTTYKTHWLKKDWYWQIHVKKTRVKQIKMITIHTSTKQSGPFRPTLTGYWMTT